MEKTQIRIELEGGEVVELSCTRYTFNPLGSEGFLLLEDGDKTAYIQLSKILKIVATKESAPATKIEIEPGAVVKVGRDKMILSKPIRATRAVTEADTEIGVGDQIAVGHYTATCQKITEHGALFFMDQYDDEARPMNDEDTNEGGYEKSDLRRRINNEESLKDFPEDIRSRLVPFENGDLIRIPTVEELFGEKECDCDDGSPWVEHLGGEQLPLMVSRANRVAYRKNEWEWGWLQNKKVASAPTFALVDGGGYADHNGASGVGGVRRAFLIGKS